MTRQEMLDAINIKIAQVKPSDYGTSYFLPVMIGHILHYVDTNLFWIEDGDGYRSRDMDSLKECIVAIHYSFIR